MTAAPVLSPTGNQPKTQLLSTTKGSWQGCNTPFTTTYQWYWSTAAPPNGTLHSISGATSSTFTPTAYVGDYVTVIVLVCDTQDVCTAATSQDGSGHTGYVYVPPAPTNTTAPTFTPSGTGQNPNSTLFTAAHGTWSSLLTISGYGYEWFRGSTQVGTASTYTSNCASDAGTTLTLKVDATNADGTSGWVASGLSAKFVPCNTAVPSFTPNGSGQDPSSQTTTYQAANGTWAGSPTSWSYEWFEGSTLVGTAATLTPNCSRDAGKTLTLKVAATNANGTAPYVAASTSASFIPCNTAAPTLTPHGTGRSVGETLATGNGTWSGATSYSYAWLRDGAPISGATGSTYTTMTTDVSHCITAKVTATNSYGASTSTSNSACVDNHLGMPNDFTFWSQRIDDRESLSVNVGNGNLALVANDLQLAGIAGFNLSLPRSYNSLYSATQDLASSQPSKGWQTVASLHVASNGDVWYTDPSGAESAFVNTGSGYTPPAGVDAQLAKNADSSYTLTFDGSNEQLNFNTSGVLQNEVDANDNSIAFTWSSGQLSSITDSLGHTTNFTYTAGQLTKITDPGNRTYLYGYDANGNLDSFTDPTNAVTKYGYDSSGRLNQITDPDGNMTQIAYDSSGRVSTVTRGLNSSGSCPVGTTCPVTSFLYAQPGGSFCPSPSTETDVTDPNMHTTRYCYDSQLRVTGTMDPLGYVTSTSYTNGGTNCSDNQPCSTTDANQNTTDFNYDGSTPQDVTKVTLTPFGGSSSTQLQASYQSSNVYLPSSSSDANQEQTSYGYTSAGELNSETDPSNGPSAPTPTTTYQYDSNGRVVKEISADGNALSDPADYTTSYAYYPTGASTGLLESVTDPLGDETTYTYDSLGRKVSEVDPNGNVSGGNPAAHTTTYTYDGDDRLLTTTDPLGHTTTYTYDADGNQITATDGNSNTTTATYNAVNELTKTTKPDPDGSGPLTAPVTSYSYDPAGNKTSETDPNNHTTTYTYDADNRMISQTDALGNETTYTYDGDGNSLTTVDPRGNVGGCGCAAQYTTTDTYDDTGELLSTTDPLGNETTNTYDGNGNKLTTVDPRGNAQGASPADHTTSYSYYPSGKVATVTAPDGGVTTYTYDADGNTLTRKDANNHTTTYTYNPADQLTSVTTPLGNKTTYSYDADGNKHGMVDANGNATGGNPAAHTTTYGYDTANRLTSTSYSDGTTPNVSFGYDAAGNRTSMTDGAGTVNYTYDNDNQLLSSTRGTDTFTYTYDPAGNITSRTYPNGTATTYGYNADEQLASVASGSDTTSYTYNPASELAQTNLPNGYVENRTYDNAGQVTAVNNARSGTVLSDFAYTPDPDGNPTKVVQTGAVSSTTLYQYDNSNRLTDACYQATTCNESAGSTDPYIHYTYDQVGNRLTEARPSGTTAYTYNADDELTQAGSTSYAYDHDGNETQAGSSTFSYDLATRNISATVGSTTSYTYDGDGNRLSATSGGGTTNYLWDTNNSLPQLALERDGGGTLIRSYIYGIRRISMNSGGNPYYYVYDALGSVANVTSSSGATEWTYSYEPFGAIRTTTQNDPQAPMNLMRFDGELYDSTTNDYYLDARELDPSTGEFGSRDPAAGQIDGPASSSYNFADDNPMVFVDPSGLMTAPGSGGSTINRKAVLDYVKQYWQHGNSLYASYSGDGGDCTNFASQALYAGGWQQTATWGFYRQCSVGPQGFGSCSPRLGTPAWINVKAFLQFATNSGRADYESFAEAKVGDIVVADLTNSSSFTPDHLEVVDRVGSDTSAGHNIWVSQHSPGRFDEPLYPTAGETQESSYERARGDGVKSPQFRLLHVF